MKLEKKVLDRFPKLGSSQDPAKLSLTVKGILVALVPILLFVAAQLNLPLVEADVTTLIEQVTSIIAAGAIIWGVIRKF